MTPPLRPRTLIGVALISIVTLRPSRTDSSTFSARSVAASLSNASSGNSPRAISCPSASRKVTSGSSSSTVWPGSSRTATIPLASRLLDTRRPSLASITATPTGVVSIARARCSARYVRAFAIAVVACAANS